METIQPKPNDANQSTGTPDGAPQGARRATGGAPSGGGRHVLKTTTAPNPEVPEKKPRRKFTAKYKLRILAEADTCTQPGQMGVLLRREGLYSSNLTTWRRQREQGILNGLAPKKRGRKNKPKNPLADKVARLEKENRKLRLKLEQAEIIIDVQKKVSRMLEMSEDQNGEKD